LADTTAEDFQSNVTAVIELLLEKPKNLKGESNVFADEINSGAYLFNRKIKQADFLKTVKLQDANDFFDRFISPGSTLRTKVSSQFFGAKCAYVDLPPRVILIKDPTAFKLSKGLLPNDYCIDFLQVSE
jgi:secreted Zn-dependent insulinase-like peptidase